MRVVIQLPIECTAVHNMEGAPQIISNVCTVYRRVVYDDILCIAISSITNFYYNNSVVLGMCAA